MENTVCRLSLALIALLCAAPAQAEPIPRVPEGASYARTRADLKYAGWQPAKADPDEQFCQIGREDVCRIYPEAKTCAGTGMGICHFTWRKGLVYIDVATEGDELPLMEVKRITCEFGCR